MFNNNVPAIEETTHDSFKDQFGLRCHHPESSTNRQNQCRLYPLIVVTIVPVYLMRGRPTHRV